MWRIERGQTDRHIHTDHWRSNYNETTEDSHQSTMTPTGMQWD